MNLLLYPITDITLNIKYKRSILPPQLKSMINNLTIKNDNGASAMRKFVCDANGNNNSINF